MKKRFIVTGGCGFIGSHLVEFLAKMGNHVTVIDNFSSGFVSNINGLSDDVKIFESSVENFLFDSLDRPDGVFHLAAQASVPYSISNFFESSMINLQSSLKVIDYCSRKDIPLVYASSSAVYGNLPFGEEHSSLDLLTPYATDKFMLEEYCKMANKLYGLRSYGHRFFNVYGPRQDPINPYSGVISIFANKILKGESVTINGGYQTRDFIYVTDVVCGVWKSYEYILKNPVSTYSNLLTGDTITIEKLSDILINLEGIYVKKIYKDLPLGDPERSQGSKIKMQSQLNMSNFVKLEDGLQRVLTWMRLEP